MLHIVIGGRATGKTHKVVEWLRRNPDGVVVVVDEQQRDFFITELMKPYLARWSTDDATRPYKTRQEAEAHVVGLGSILSGAPLQGKRGREQVRLPIAVDNLDMVLARLFAGNEPELATMTTGYVEAIQVSQLTPDRW